MKGPEDLVRQQPSGMWRDPSHFSYPTKARAVAATQQMFDHPEWVAMGTTNREWLRRAGVVI